MFKICPFCENDKLKVKVMGRREYDPATYTMTMDGEIPVVEYRCPACGWTVLVEDPAELPKEVS